ncbi:MAG: electron transfer flavoprotein subunit alpha/FixB family protein, partial [Candidatus Omnitrophica bacterium]|nr:electron transfer flavoprotein subunit alpha/FixB family protein [Candidatus Omnitrophota bacterium]
MSAGMIVLVEHLKGQITEISFEMLGVGRSLADALKIPLWPVVLGPEGASLAARLGIADAVLLAEDPRLEMPSPEVVVDILNNLMQQKQAFLVLVGGTNVSMGIGARLSLRARVPMVNFCKGIKIENGAVLATSQLFGGKILSDVRLTDQRGIISVYPGSFPADAGRREGTPPVEKLQIPAPAPAVAFRRFIEPAAGDVDITKQDILVAVGRGIQSADNLGLAEELADVLGGAICASRPVIDQGWLPLTRQVGKSGTPA